MLVDYNFGDWLLLDHSVFLSFAELESVVVAVTHYDIKVGVVFIVHNSDDLIVVV